MRSYFEKCLYAPGWRDPEWEEELALLKV